MFEVKNKKKKSIVKSAQNSLKRKYRFNKEINDDEQLQDFKNAFSIKCTKCKIYKSINKFDKYDINGDLLCSDCK